MAPASPALPKKPGHALLKSGEAQLPVSLFGNATRKYDAARFINAGVWIRDRRLELRMTQKTASGHLGIPLRQLLSYEAVARWPEEAREFVRRNSTKIGVGLLIRRCANRRWGSKVALLAELQRIVEGKAPRRRPGSREIAQLNADLLAIEERIRNRLSLKVIVSGDGITGEIRISYHSPDQLERFIETIEG